METITITEALSAVKLIEKKLEKKRAMIKENLIRYKHVPDPFTSDGGSKKALSQERQSITDLQTRLESIRAAIAKANLETAVTIDNDTKSLHAWLTWKREIVKNELASLTQWSNHVKAAIDQFSRTPQVMKDKEDKTVLVEMEPNLEYSELIKSIEALTQKLEKLDGQLSLKNATVTVNL